MYYFRIDFLTCLIVCVIGERVERRYMPLIFYFKTIVFFICLVQ